MPALSLDNCSHSLTNQLPKSRVSFRIFSCVSDRSPSFLPVHSGQLLEGTQISPKAPSALLFCSACVKPRTATADRRQREYAACSQPRPRARAHGQSFPIFLPLSLSLSLSLSRETLVAFLSIWSLRRRRRRHNCHPMSI